jgi:bacterioferritin-associated ferredoxin
MLVCHCKGVSDRAVRRTVRAGANTASQVGEECGAGTCCGGCIQTINEIIHTESSAVERNVTQPVTLPTAHSNV